jgi:integrase
LGTKKRINGDGTTRQLPSGRWQARHVGPDGVRRSAPVTFDTKLDAAAWLRAQTMDVERGTWAPPTRRQTVRTLRGYWEGWLPGRDLKPRTRALYRGLLDSVILPDLGDVPLDRLAPSTVRTWHDSLDKSKPTRRAHAYGLLRSILTTAVADDLIPTNPCRVRGGGSSRKKHKTRIATQHELATIVANVPPRYRAMVLLASWCAMRFGELAELRRSDVDIAAAVVHVRRAVTRAGSDVWIGDPKSEARRRSVIMPPHIVADVAAHLSEHVGEEPDALLFPSNGDPRKHMTPSTLQRVWEPARKIAGRDDLHFHDLRHTGLTLFAAAGATLADLQARGGHSTAAAALRYQHAAADRQRKLAEGLSALAVVE